MQKRYMSGEQAQGSIDSKCRNKNRTGSVKKSACLDTNRASGREGSADRREVSVLLVNFEQLQIVAILICHNEKAPCQINFELPWRLAS